MKDLIEALQIFAKYTDTASPTHCEHDMLLVMVEPSTVSPRDRERLSELGFVPDGVAPNFISFRFGSA